MCFRVVVALVFCTSHAFAGVWGDFIRSRRTPRFKTGLEVLQAGKLAEAQTLFEAAPLKT